MKSMMMYQLSLLALFSAVSSLDAMFFERMSGIERQLVEREIKRREIAAVRQEIENAGDPKKIDNDLRCGVTCPVVLSVKTVFKKENCHSDALVKDIFAEIQKKELKHGYIPEAIKTVAHGAVCVTMAMNFVGNSHAARYYWVDDSRSAVKIKARFFDKPALKEIVDNYRE